MDAMAIFVLMVELIGTIAFSASGSIIAIRKKMDVFGVCVLGLTTAVFGGVFCDLLLPAVTKVNLSTSAFFHIRVV